MLPVLCRCPHALAGLDEGGGSTASRARAGASFGPVNGLEPQAAQHSRGLHSLKETDPHAHVAT